MPARPKSAEWREIVAEVGDRVRRRREELGLSQEDLAAAAFMHRNQVQNIEQARGNTKDPTGTPDPSNPTLDTIYLLAGALQVEVADLLPQVPPKRQIR